MENPITAPVRDLSLLQLVGIISVANTAIRLIANRPPAPIVYKAFERAADTATAE